VPEERCRQRIEDEVILDATAASEGGLGNDMLLVLVHSYQHVRLQQPSKILYDTIEGSK